MDIRVKIPAMNRTIQGPLLRSAFRSDLTLLLCFGGGTTRSLVGKQLCIHWQASSRRASSTSIKREPLVCGLTSCCSAPVHLDLNGLAGSGVVAHFAVGVAQGLLHLQTREKATQATRSPREAKASGAGKSKRDKQN